MRNTTYLLLGFLISLIAFIPFADAFDVENVTVNEYNSSNTRCYSWNYLPNPTTNTGSYDSNLGMYYSTNGLYLRTTTRISMFDITSYSVGSCTGVVNYVDENGTLIEPEPEYCSDGVKSPLEDGVDCGGGCTNGCEAVCGDNESLACVTADGVTTCSCFFTAPPDAFGNCKAPSILVDGVCFNERPAPLFDSGVPQSESDTYSTENTTAIEDLSDGIGVVNMDNLLLFHNGQETTTSSTAIDTVDNGDGASTTTTTSSSSSSTGESSTDVETTVVDNSTGEIISSNTESTEETAPEDNPENYEYAGDFGTTGTDTGQYIGVLSAEDLPEEKEVSVLLDLVNDVPIFAVLDSFEANVTVPECNLSLGEFRGTMLDIDFCRWGNYLDTFGDLLLLITQASAIVLVITGWRPREGNS